MLNAARAQGRPMMVMAMMTEATSQPNAIQAPPIRIQSRLSRSETGAMVFVRDFPCAKNRRSLYRPETCQCEDGRGRFRDRRAARERVGATDLRRLTSAKSASMVSAQVTRLRPRRLAA